jgi:hypothetical protein
VFITQIGSSLGHLENLNKLQNKLQSQFQYFISEAFKEIVDLEDDSGVPYV